MGLSNKKEMRRKQQQQQKMKLQVRLECKRKQQQEEQQLEKQKEQQREQEEQPANKSASTDTVPYLAKPPQEKQQRQKLNALSCEHDITGGNTSLSLVQEIILGLATKK